MTSASRHPSSSPSRSVSPLRYHPVDAGDFENSYEMGHRSLDVDNSEPSRRSLSPDVGPSRNRSQGPYVEVSQADHVRVAAPTTPTRPSRPMRSRFKEVESPGSPESPVESISHKNTFNSRSGLAGERTGPVAQWKITWIIPASLLVLYVSGVIAAFGHHLFYASLDGKPATDQLKMIRYGTALAFFVKSALVGTVVLCHRQRIWHTLRKKAMTIKAIDGLFAATEDPLKFGNWEMIRNGKMATMMALCSWLLPIASVLSPAALTTDVRTLHEATTCPAVSTLDFSHESGYDFRKMTDFPGFSLAFYNTTDVKAEREGWFDYYDQPSKNARRLAYTSVYLGKAASNPVAPLRSCGEGWNCTYVLEFKAPGYNCKDITIDVDDEAPFNLSVLAPQGDRIYKAAVDLGDYANPQIETGTNAMPVMPPPYPDSLGAFQAEPALWMGYAIKKPSNEHESKMFKCVLYETKYLFNMTYHGLEQTATRLSREWLEPLVDTKVPYDPINGSTLTPVPVENHMLPGQDASRYKLAAAYHALGALMRNFLRGEIVNMDPRIVTKSDISETRLLDPKTSYPVPNLMEEFQSFFEDMIITLLSEPHLVIADTTSVPCDKSQTVNVYVYQREGLWIGYSIVVSVTLGFIIIGIWSIYQNGVASGTTFSRIMVTTRNPTLDRLSVGACLGGDPLPKDLQSTKLRFGVLLEDSSSGSAPFGKVEHCAFGAEHETKEIVKHGVYAGLKRWRKEDGEDWESGDWQEKQGLLSGED